MASAPSRPGSRLLSGGLRPFAYSQFRVLWGASLTSIMSFFMLMIARGWLILEMTDSPFLVTAVQAVSMVPMMFLSPFGGVVADRLDRRLVLIASDVSNLVILLVLALLLFAGVAEVWHVFVLALLNGVTFSLTMPARASSVPDVVPPDAIASGTSIYSTIFSTSQLVGPALAGYLMKMNPEQFGWAFLAASMLLVPSVGLLLRLRLPSKAGAAGPRPGVLKSMGEGVRYIRGRTLLIGLLLTGLVFTLFGMPYQALLPVFARDVLNTGPDGLGLLGAFGGAGAIVGSLAVAFLSKPRQLKLLMIGGSLGFGALVILFAASTVLAISLVLAMLLGFMMQVFITSNFAILQVATPSYILGRVLGLRFLVMGVGPIGMLVLGSAAVAIGPARAVGFMGLASLVTTVLVVLLFSSLRRIEHEMTPPPPRDAPPKDDRPEDAGVPTEAVR